MNGRPPAVKAGACCWRRAPGDTVKGLKRRTVNRMTSDLACCTEAERIPAVARLMQQYNCGAVPVLRNQETRELVGSVTDRDRVCRATARDLGPTTTMVEAVFAPAPQPPDP